MNVQKIMQRKVTSLAMYVLITIQSARAAFFGNNSLLPSNIYMRNTKINLFCLACLVLLAVPLAGAADFRLPSFSSGWADLPTDVQVWVQRLIDWAIIAAAVVAIGSAIFHFTRGRFEEGSGSVVGRASATSGLVGTIAWSVVLLVAIILIFNLLTK